MRVVVVGGVAGGASAAARIRRLDETAQVDVFERGPDVSFSNCALPYYLGGVVEDAGDLIMATPEEFRKKYNISVHTGHEVLRIDRAAKTVTVRDGTGDCRDVPYDKLVLATGASPVVPANISGVDQDHVYTIRNVQDITAVKARMDRDDTKNVVVVGGGFIGVEVAENLKKTGKNVTIVEGLPQILTPFDHDMVQAIQKELDDNGVAVIVSGTVTAVERDCVRVARTANGVKTEQVIPADAVVLSIGVAPETALAKEAGLAIGETRGIRVNRYMQTSDPDIYAVGDVAESFNRQTGLPGRLALAGPAQKQARIAADHICGIASENPGFIGASCIRVFGLNAAAVGLNARGAEAAGASFDHVTVYAPDKVGIMPDCHYVALKLLFEVPSGKLLGAQAIGQGEVDKRIDVVAALIGMGGSVKDLWEYEHCYAPLFSTAKDAVHMAALVASNVLSGRLRQIHVDEVRRLVEDHAYIVDVREEEEFAWGHLKGAHNIPLTALRARADEIPRDVPVYLHCRSSQRSYYAYCYLRGSGFANVSNISGSFLGISLYEYFEDKTEGRTPIVTEYNFN